MEFSPDQSVALAKINKWLSNKHDRMFMLGGYAGTGKTTLIQHLVNNSDWQVPCLAPTGKAVHVLKGKFENANVMTIHRALYVPKKANLKRFLAFQEQLKLDPDNEGLKEKVRKEARRLDKIQVEFEKRETPLIARVPFVIIDEASMVTKEMVNDIMEAGCKALFVGDPGQLPPVKNEQWFTTDKLDYILAEIHRQAEDNPIIRISVDARFGTLNPRDYQFDECRIVHKSRLTRDDWRSANQVITGYNQTRKHINRTFRRWLGLSDELPMEGDKLICLKNEYKRNCIFDEKRSFVDCYECVPDLTKYNPTMKRCKHRVNWINGLTAEAAKNAVVIEHSDDEPAQTYYSVDIKYGNKVNTDVTVIGADCLSNYNDKLAKLPYDYRGDRREFDYAYAITAHKSQGSEWDSIIIADDRWKAGETELRKRWLYTAITRAKSKLIIAEGFTFRNTRLK